ncbi:MAG: SurA N-terminal domain-containing protein [Rhodobacteraceae bacterium]|nr:SurA N-terminal domain-containing protein [Paracoccaceae bacterium]
MTLMAFRHWLVATLLMVLALAVSDKAKAQNAFSPIAKVGGGVVTLYELDQRALFLTLLEAGEDTRTLAFEQLINERLQLDTAATFGVTLPEEAIIAAEAEFAAQGQFTREEFIAALETSGVGASTFRNFIEAGLLWREVVGGQFANRINVSEAEIDRVLASVPSQGGLRVLVNEIVLPAGSPQTEAASRARADRLAQITTFDEFQAAARLFSVSNSRFQGGEIDWRAVEALPAEAGAQMSGLQPGQVTRPVLVNGAIVLYQLRDSETVQPGSRQVVSAEYAIFQVPGGRDEAARIAARVRTCDDLYGEAFDGPPERLSRVTQQISQLPADVAREIESMDDNETSLNLTRGGQATVLMLCRRTLNQSSAVDRDQVRGLIFAQRLETFSQGFLNELRFNTDIEVIQ